MAPVQQAMSLWLEGIDPSRYKSYREQIDRMIAEDTGMEAITFKRNQSFLGLACLRNLQSYNHRDKGKVKDGWVGMICTGAFTCGELCLPDLKMKVRCLPDDVVFLRGCALQHIIAPTVWERSSLVFFFAQ